MNDNSMGALRGLMAALAVEACAVGVGWLAWHLLGGAFW